MGMSKLIDIDLKKINFQNVSAYYSKSSKKYYLTHFDCYYKFKKDLNQSIKPLNEISSAKISPQEQSIDISQLIPNNRKFNFITVEAYHPISSYLHFKAEKSATGFEETHQVTYHVLDLL